MPVTAWRVLQALCCRACECSSQAVGLLPGMAPSGCCARPRYLQNRPYIMHNPAYCITLILMLSFFRHQNIRD
jgi:hypothetical protein